MEGIWAVHATDRIMGGKLVPHVNGRYPQILCDGISNTIHFSLNQLVPSHRGGNWEEKNHAILIPLEELAPQVINLWSVDTFILGEFSLPSSAVVLSRSSCFLPNLPCQQILFQEQSLREVVEEFLQGKTVPLSLTELLPLFPHSSFGDDIISLRGTAYITQIVRIISSGLFISLLNAFPENKEKSYAHVLLLEFLMTRYPYYFSSRNWEQLNYLRENFKTSYPDLSCLPRSFLYSLERYLWEDFFSIYGHVEVNWNVYKVVRKRLVDEIVRESERM